MANCTIWVNQTQLIAIFARFIATGAFSNRTGEIDIIVYRYTTELVDIIVYQYQ